MGADWAARFARARFAGVTDPPALGTTDGRMMLHEWPCTSPEYLKTDAVDHLVDHFSPGCHDSAWDLAACLVEWDLDRPMQNYLLGRYCAVARDATLPRRLPFYTIAYLAHGLGYATLASHTLGPESPDGRRFRALVTRYGARLQQELLPW